MSASRVPGHWDFRNAPKVNGVALGTGGGSLPISTGANKVLFDDGATQDWSDNPMLAALRVGGSDDIGSVTTIEHSALNLPAYIALGVRGVAADAAGGVFAQAGSFEVQIPEGLSHDVSSLISLYTQISANVPEGRTITGAHGLQSNVENAGPGTIGTLRGFFSQIDNYGGGHVGKAEVITGYLYDNTAGAIYGSAAIFAGYFEGEVDDSITTGYGIWLGDMSGAAMTNGYAFWYDAPGVYRIKKDGVMAYYNPAHTKYTPGATDYERIVQQWNSDVAEYGTEAGATGGTLRSLRLKGEEIRFAAPLPTPDATFVGTPVLAGDGAGNVDNGTHHYKFTFYDYVSEGETALGTASDAVVVADKTVDGKVRIPIPRFYNSVSETLKIYRDADDGVYKLVTEVATDVPGVYIDNTADADLGAVGPTTNTTQAERVRIVGNRLTTPLSPWWQDGTEGLGLGAYGTAYFHLVGAPGIAVPGKTDGMWIYLTAGDGYGTTGAGGALYLDGGKSGGDHAQNGGVYINNVVNVETESVLSTKPVTAPHFIGPVVLPTSDPHIAGALWNNSNAFAISAG